MQRTVAHIDLDTFFVSCERLMNSKLNNRPVIIGGTSGRGVVAACSYEARYYGVRSAMPMKYALQLCPDAIVLRGDMELYSRKSWEVTEIIRDQAPVLEQGSIDEFYVDVSGLDRFFGCYQWTNELVARITSEAGLPVSFGLSLNKTVAKIATGEGKPEGRLEVSPGKVKPFLNPLSIRKIPMLGQQTFYTLSRIGIRKIRTLAELPPPFLQHLLGKNGTSLWQKANGIDNTPVVPHHERKGISTEMTFERDTMDVNGLRALLVSMVEKLTYQLRSEGKLVATVAVKIRYTNFDTHTRQCRIPYTANDQVLLKAVFELFDKVYVRRMLVRLIGIRFSGLVGGHYQIDLFDDRPEIIALYQAMDRMKRRFGSGAVKRAVTMGALQKNDGN